jgi:hypothetical protein
MSLKNLVIPIILIITAILPAGTHVFWYKGITNKYNLSDCGPGPCLPPNAIIHESMIATGSVASHSGTSEASLVFGSGPDDQQGRCGFIWSADLIRATGSADMALIRAEYRDGWSGEAFCNAGPIDIRLGVVDFTGNYPDWAGYFWVPETADWQDFLNPLHCGMGYDFMNPILAAEEIKYFQAPAGRQGESEPSLLDGQFMEVDVTDQVNWILENSGDYAIVLLVCPYESSTGKVNTYSQEDGTGRKGLGSDHPWTIDGNTAHIVVYGEIDAPGIEEDGGLGLSEASIGPAAPNPFNPTTLIPYNTGRFEKGLVKIYDIQGRLVFSQNIKGKGHIIWHAGHLSSGLFILRARIGQRTYERKLLLQK